MARIRYPEEDAATETKEIFDELKLKRGKVLNSFKLMAHRPKLLRAFSPLLKEIRVPHTKKLNNGLKELIHYRISSLNRCEYCITHSYHLAQSFRREPEEILAIQKGDLSQFEPHEKIALEFAEAIANDRVDQELINRVKEHFDEGEIVELVMTVGVFVLLNIFNKTLGTDLDSQPGPAEIYPSTT